MIQRSVADKIRVACCVFIHEFSLGNKQGKALIGF